MIDLTPSAGPGTPWVLRLGPERLSLDFGPDIDHPTAEIRTRATSS